MHVLLFAATGLTGQRLLTELLSRSHQVTAVVRDPAKLSARPNLTILEGSVSSAEAIRTAISAARPSPDAIVSAYGPGHLAANVGELVAVTQHFIDALTGNPTRFLYVGGAASLLVAPGVTLLASGHLPAEWLPIAQAHADALALIETSSINWTCFSPAAYFEPGERTGSFRIAQDTLLMDANGQSRISMEDYAIAAVDELETPHFLRQRFTAGY